MSLSDEKISEIIKNLKFKEEKLIWRNDKRHNDFIEFITKNIKASLDSDEFIYDDTLINPYYTGEEFSDLLASLFSVVNRYAIEHNISKIDDSVGDKYYLKLKDKYYSIELIVGQGSFVRIENVNNCKGCSYIDYGDMVKVVDDKI